MDRCPSDVGVCIDREKAMRWIYPSNVPTRQYQMDIVRTAMFNNTLVCLPTGLGKTLIAAVVMYNFYNWFPKGKIVFLAPTKPLVDQQREACLYQVSMAQHDTAEMTGRQRPEVRRTLWKEKRVFFCTPQIFERDLLKDVMSSKEFVCVVVDECHKSTGNYATVKAIEFLRKKNVQFRVLGLSATPGRTKPAIQEMLDNLMISTVEFRDENDPEISQHTHDKAVEAITVNPQPELCACYRMVHSVLESVIQPLVQAGVLHVGNPESVTRYGLLTSLQRFKPRCRQFRNASRLTALFNQGIFLASVSESLDCGIRIALDFINASMQEKAWLREITNKYPTFNQLTGTLQKLIASNYEHPKFQKLMEVLKDHFSSASAGSRVIIFTSLRDTVVDIVESLERHKDPHISAKSLTSGDLPVYLSLLRWFIGQGSGAASGKHKMTQPQQKSVLEDFRNGKFSTLVATCIAEEGLDIPEVQLIVCFDGAASPLRDTQRMGRTGRHAQGRVVYLLAEGKERRKYDRNNNESGYIKTLLRRSMYHFSLYEHNPRMIPLEYNPEMLMLRMETTNPKDLKGKGSRKREGTALNSSGAKQTRLDSFMKSLADIRETPKEDIGGDALALERGGEVVTALKTEAHADIMQRLQASTAGVLPLWTTPDPASVEKAQTQGTCRSGRRDGSHATSSDNKEQRLDLKGERDVVVGLKKLEVADVFHRRDTSLGRKQHIDSDCLPSAVSVLNVPDQPRSKSFQRNETPDQQNTSVAQAQDSAEEVLYMGHTISAITKKVFLKDSPSKKQCPDNCPTTENHLHVKESSVGRSPEVKTAHPPPESVTEASRSSCLETASPDSGLLIPCTTRLHARRRVLCDDSTASKNGTPPSRRLETVQEEHHRTHNTDPGHIEDFLDLDAVVSGSEGNTLEDDVEGMLLEDLELFIDDSEPVPDSVNMMAVYRQPLSDGASTPDCASRERRPFRLTPGTTPFSAQSSYESSFVTNGSGALASGSANGESTVERTLQPRKRICEICHKTGKFIVCSRCKKLFHISCITLQTSLSGRWECGTCNADNIESVR